MKIKKSVEIRVLMDVTVDASVLEENELDFEELADDLVDYLRVSDVYPLKKDVTLHYDMMIMEIADNDKAEA